MHNTADEKSKTKQPTKLMFIVCCIHLGLVPKVCIHPIIRSFFFFSILFLFDHETDRTKKGERIPAHIFALFFFFFFFFFVSYIVCLLLMPHKSKTRIVWLLIGQFHMHVVQWIKRGIRSAASSSIEKKNNSFKNSLIIFLFHPIFIRDYFIDFWICESPFF